ncbi:MAG: class I SAM-dependent methyltransferase [Anaerolineae bacterium]
MDRSEAYRCTSLGYGVHPPIVKCGSCGMVYANPRREAHEISAAYENVEDPAYLAERDGRVLTFRRNLAPLERLVSPGDSRRLLDVGCHVGILLEIAQDRGWEAWGVEPSVWAAKQAGERGLKVITGTLAEARFPDEHFHSVTMWDVVEHLLDPRQELAEAHRVLAPGGAIAVHTMNIESPLARLLGHRWPWLMEMHLHYFSPKSLSRLLESTGFQVEILENQGRYLRLGYLLSRLEPYLGTAAQGIGRLVRSIGVHAWPVPINLGDLFTIFARKA